MLEIDRLDAILKEAGIPFERDDEDLRPEHSYWMYRIAYPKKVIVDGHFDTVCSIIQGDCSYGGNENLLEIMGLLTVEEAEHDSVCGHLTAGNVFERIKKHWESDNK
ncbi:MAG: hypothetical protein IKL58_00330 [Phascolarctobacterium sp.]|nr:hypothetical protein [Phascolarctobacterium sp.]